MIYSLSFTHPLFWSKTAAHFSSSSSSHKPSLALCYASSFSLFSIENAGQNIFDRSVSKSSNLKPFETCHPKVPLIMSSCMYFYISFDLGKNLKRLWPHDCDFMFRLFWSKNEKVHYFAFKVVVNHRSILLDLYNENNHLFLLPFPQWKDC